ncbi:T9SS type A sorting domain-containing protein [bacterium]|nr:T9SS type A sorting domain-containing protein [bacterium]
MRKCLLIIGLLMSGLVHFSFAATWTIDKVTDNTSHDDYPFISAIQSGLLVVYVNHDPDYEIFVANNFSGSWTTSRVTDNSHNDIGYDIAAKYGEQTAHIAHMWQDVPDNEISYTKGSPASWSTERITDDANDDERPVIALDNSGFVHVVYSKNIGGDQEIFYANNVSGSWISEQVTDNGSDDEFPWMALDKSGNPRIVYRNGSQLHYTYKTAGIWTAPVMVAGSMGANSYPFVVLDKNDKAHVAFAKSDGSFNQIYYANDVTGTWQESKVTSTSYNNLYPTIFIDPSSKAHIAYMAAEPGDAEMFYATNASGIWSIGRVTDNSFNDAVIFGRYFTCDAQGIGHMVFINNSDGDSEVYHAQSNEPLYAGIEENSSSSPLLITVSSILSASSTITYSVPTAGIVSLKVYDASGALVKNLVNGMYSAGQYNVSWNGITDAGSKATSGVYFCRLETAQGAVSAKTIVK